MHVALYVIPRCMVSLIFCSLKRFAPLCTPCLVLQITSHSWAFSEGSYWKGGICTLHQYLLKVFHSNCLVCASERERFNQSVHKLTSNVEIEAAVILDGGKLLCINTVHKFIEFHDRSIKLYCLTYCNKKKKKARESHLILSTLNSVTCTNENILS